MGSYTQWRALLPYANVEFVLEFVAYDGHFFKTFLFSVHYCRLSQNVACRGSFQCTVM